MALTEKALDIYNGCLINKIYRIGKLIGAGSYGQVRFGTHSKKQKNFAIKFEVNGPEAQLRAEYELLQYISKQAKPSSEGFPAVYYHGKFNEMYNVLVMDLLGKNLCDVFVMCGFKFSLKSIVFITLQLLDRFQTLHALGIIHRDVKPDNFVLGRNSNTIHLVDFGLSKSFKGKKGHFAWGETGEYVGTTRYMSINAHRCFEQSRRDDLEAICYVLAYFFANGRLPWSCLPGKDFSEHNELVLQKKLDLTEVEIMRDAPTEFVNLLIYVRSMKFKTAPCYTKLRIIFKRLFSRNNFKNDGMFDWNRCELRLLTAALASSAIPAKPLSEQ